MAPSCLPLSITLPSDLRYLAVARSFLEAACAAHGIAGSLQEDIILAVHEAVSNVIRHAHHEESSSILQIVCLIDTGKIEVDILDEGDPFDLNNVPLLDPAELRIGGRGVFLMRALMDRVCCEHREPRGNRMSLVKYFSNKCPLDQCG